MKLLRLCVASLFIIVLFAFIILKFQQITIDTSIPEITVTEGILDVTIDVTTEELLEGVTAYDKKDGNLTDKIIVESISRFTEPGVSIVRYAVCDSNNHVAFATRTLRYTNYTPPRFSLSDSLVFNISDKINIRNILGAVDAIDGDISNKVIITANEYTATIPGLYYISAKVVNNKGDMIMQTFPVYIEDRSLAAPQIELKQYIVYLKTGEDFDIHENVLTILDANGEEIVEEITIDTNFDPSTPGMYEIHYRVTDSLGRTGHEFVIVIVE